jgi:crotonobetaine/carnitine-CoA ligase
MQIRANGIRIEVDGREALPGETGEFLIKGVRGLSLFAEYLNNPQATADSFDEHGWFKTGDRVTLGENGWLYFADRSKDMLKVGGENVAASEIEQVIAVVPGVLEVAIVGLRHPMLDEVPVAFVRAQASDDASRAALVAAINTACSTTLSGFKQPREVRIVEDRPAIATVVQCRWEGWLPDALGEPRTLRRNADELLDALAHASQLRDAVGGGE